MSTNINVTIIGFAGKLCTGKDIPLRIDFTAWASILPFVYLVV